MGKRTVRGERMSRLIDADALREAIAGHVCTVSTCGTVAEAKAKMEFKKQVLQDIEEQPTIEAEPVRRGHWEHDAYIGNLYKCTACGMGMYTSENYLLEHKYCFKCGAKMDEEVRNGNT